jgi:hypothetical protein
MRDIDADARMVMRVYDADANGVESKPVDRLSASEFDTPEPNTRRSYHSAKRGALRNFKEMIKRDDRGYWIKARCDEPLKLKDGWYYCESPKAADCRPVRVRTMCVLKRHADGSVGRYKRRMVLDCGKLTKRDVGGTFQHVAEVDSPHFMCTHAAQFGLVCVQADIEGAFLNETPPTKMHCYPPDGERAPIDKAEWQTNDKMCDWKHLRSLGCSSSARAVPRQAPTELPVQPF